MYYISAYIDRSPGAAVYSEVEKTVFVVFFSAHLHIFWNIGDLLTTLGSIGCIAWMLSIPTYEERDNEESSTYCQSETSLRQNYLGLHSSISLSLLKIPKKESLCILDMKQIELERLVTISVDDGVIVIVASVPFTCFAGPSESAEVTFYRCRLLGSGFFFPIEFMNGTSDDVLALLQLAGPSLSSNLFLKQVLATIFEDAATDCSVDGMDLMSKAKGLIICNCNIVNGFVLFWYSNSDRMGALAYFTEVYGYNGPVYMMVKKLYTITKQKQKWKDEERQRFLHQRQISDGSFSMSSVMTSYVHGLSVRENLRELQVVRNVLELHFDNN
ncbi:hypothetical protein ACFE04_006387 [Oxalis oulophora]